MQAVFAAMGREVSPTRTNGTSAQVHIGLVVCRRTPLVPRTTWPSTFVRNGICGRDAVPFLVST